MTWQHVVIAALTLFGGIVTGAALRLWAKLAEKDAEIKRLNDDRVTRAEAYATERSNVAALYRADNAETREVLRETSVTLNAWLGEDDRR